MTVYNTATAGTMPNNVTPGWYYNDGQKWVRLAVTDNNTNLFGSGAPTGGCSPSTIYTDTSGASPTQGQQWTCVGGNWVAYNAPAATEWYLNGNYNDAGANKVAAINRSGNIAIKNISGDAVVYVAPLAGNAAAVDLDASVVGGHYYSVRSWGTAGASNFSIDDNTTGARRFSIDANGHVGINTTAIPATALAVYGGAYINNIVGGKQEPSGAFFLDANDSGADRKIYLNWNNGAGGGNAVVGNGAANYGTIFAAAFSQVSDKRLKENIQDIKTGLNTVMALRPVLYDYKNGDKNRNGFIAQEVYKVLPNIVHTTDAGTGAAVEPAKAWSVNYIDLVPVLTKAIQDLQKQVEAMQAELDRLKK
jgi:hypothetical protein